MGAKDLAHCGSSAAHSRDLPPFTPRRHGASSSASHAACLLPARRTARRPPSGRGCVQWPAQLSGPFPGWTVVKEGLKFLLL
jgi:hypothetical protein